MKRVLVTGATGFVGRQSLAPLAARSYEIHAVTPGVPLMGVRGVHWHVGDLLDAATTQTIVARVRPTHLLHFAWRVEPGEFWTAPENITWVAASLRLLSAFSECGGQRVVMAGTCAEYDWAARVLRERETPLRPATLYGVCKHALHMLLETLASQRRFSAAWGRLFWLYGPHERPGRLVSSVVGALLQGRPAECTHGGQVRDFLCTEDAADAFVALLDSDVAGPVNIASGRPVTVRHVVETIAGQMGGTDLLRFDARQAPANDPPHIEAAVERLTTEVGWAPKTSLVDGLQRTIAWWRSASLAQ